MISQREEAEALQHSNWDSGRSSEVYGLAYIDNGGTYYDTGTELDNLSNPVVDGTADAGGDLFFINKNNVSSTLVKKSPLSSTCTDPSPSGSCTSSLASAL